MASATMWQFGPAVRWTLSAEILVAAVLLAVEFARRRRAGPLLFDLGFNRPWRIGAASPHLRLILGIFFVFLGGVQTFLRGRSGTRWVGLINVLLGELWIAAKDRKVQIRQAGILAGKLLRWNEIQEYEVSPRGFLRLMLRDGAWRRLDVEIAEADQPRVASLLQPRVPAHNPPVPL